MAIEDPLQPGGRYPLPVLPVTNSGSVETTYQVAILAVEGQPQLEPEPSWFDVKPARFRLAAGEQLNVALALELPWFVQTGSYAGLIQVKPVVDVEGTGLAAAVATRFSFRVEHSNVVVAWANNAIDALQARAPWSFLLLGIVLVVLAYPVLGGLFGIRLSIERRS